MTVTPVPARCVARYIRPAARACHPRRSIVVDVWDTSCAAAPRRRPLRPLLVAVDMGWDSDIRPAHSPTPPAPFRLQQLLAVGAQLSPPRPSAIPPPPIAVPLHSSRSPGSALRGPTLTAHRARRHRRRATECRYTHRLADTLRAQFSPQQPIAAGARTGCTRAALPRPLLHRTPWRRKEGAIRLECAHRDPSPAIPPPALHHRGCVCGMLLGRGYQSWATPGPRRAIPLSVCHRGVRIWAPSAPLLLGSRHRRGSARHRRVGGDIRHHLLPHPPRAVTLSLDHGGCTCGMVLRCSSSDVSRVCPCCTRISFVVVTSGPLVVHLLYCPVYRYRG
jgi:hypothetical protein